MLATVERALPDCSRRDWGELAVAAARRAGLPEADVQALRRALEDEFAVSGEAAVRRPGSRGNVRAV